MKKKLREKEKSSEHFPNDGSKTETKTNLERLEEFIQIQKEELRRREQMITERLKEAGMEDGSTAAYCLGHQDALRELGELEGTTYIEIREHVRKAAKKYAFIEIAGRFVCRNCFCEEVLDVADSFLTDKDIENRTNAGEVIVCADHEPLPGHSNLHCNYEEKSELITETAEAVAADIVELRELLQTQEYENWTEIRRPIAVGMLEQNCKRMEFYKLAGKLDEQIFELIERRLQRELPEVVH